MASITPKNRPEKLQIGSLTVTPPVIMAPMESLTDLPFRRMVRRLGGLGLTFTEFVASEAIIRDVPRALEMAALDPDEHPGGIQIYGRRPESMAEAARRVQDMGADLVDINMGCPSRKVCAHSGGAALLRDPDLVGRIVAAVRKATTLPLTVKIRSGFSPDQRNGPEVAWICQEEGADAVTVHWRTREEAFKGPMNPAPIADVVAAVTIPVIGNGDVVDAESAARMLDATGCHALMVGRGVVRNPWLPLQLSQWLSGEQVCSPSARDRLEFFIEYMEAVTPLCRTELGALGRVKRFAGYFTRGLSTGAALRQSVFHSLSLGEAQAAFEDWYARAAACEEGGQVSPVLPEEGALAGSGAGDHGL